MSELPKLVRSLQQVFDDLWQELEPHVVKMDADQQRTALAGQIIKAHKSGLKPEEIKTILIRKYTADGSTV